MTQCSKCGDCCENIHVGMDMNKIRRIAYQVPAHPEWQSGWVKFNESIESARFALNVWKFEREGREGGSIFSCPRFDAEARLCTAHDERPPVCSGFPWYGDDPNPEDLTKLPPRCTFNADIRTNLPIVRIN